MAGLTEKIVFKVALLALTKFGYISLLNFNSFVLDIDRMLWVLLNFGTVMFVCL